MHKKTPQPRIVKLQQEVQDAGSIHTHVDLAVQVDDKASGVLVGDQPIDVKLLSGEKMKDATCSTSSLC